MDSLHTKGVGLYFIRYKHFLECGHNIPFDSQGQQAAASCRDPFSDRDVQICMSTSIIMISTVKDFETTTRLVCTALCTLPYLNVSSWLVGNDADTSVSTDLQMQT